MMIRFKPQRGEQHFVLHDVHVMNDSGRFGDLVDVEVRDGRIECVGVNLSPPDTVVCDVGGLWLMPGIVDCHAHIAATYLDPFEALSTPVTRWTLEAALNAQLVLHAGVTSLRDASGADAGLRDAIADGVIEGPDVAISCVMLSETGGHGDELLAGTGQSITPGYYIPDYPSRPPFLVDSPDAMRATVRAVLRAGADWIKIATTGGVLSATDRPDLPQFTFEEISVAVTEAARKGVAVMAHANGGVGLDDAIRAGVRSIEHGWLLTEKQASDMAQAGCFLVPTLTIARDAVEWARAGRLPAEAAAKALAIEERIGENVRIAQHFGVPMTLGSDFVAREQHGRNLVEIDELRLAGLTAEQALLAATKNGAVLCGKGDSHGSIAPGFVFDAVITSRDPSDTNVFRDRSTVAAVFQAGRLVKSSLPGLDAINLGDQ